MKEQIHLHFVSAMGGSIWEITNELIPFFEKEFVLTKEWLFEIPEKRQVLLCHFLKPELFLDADVFDSFEKKIIIQPIDGTELTEAAIQMLNCYDLIITPAEAGKKIMRACGVIADIIVIPNYYKSNIFEKKIYTEIEKYIPSNKIIFYHESTFHPRKGIELLYEGFIRAFADSELAYKVVLVCKDMPFSAQFFDRNEALKEQAINLQKTFVFPPTILKFSCYLEEDELKALWNRANAYVSLAKIEGFGIPMLRMFLMNKPIICLDNENSGYQDYLKSYNESVYKIPTIQTKAVDEFMWLYNKETKWAIPNMQDVVNAFRKCANDIIEGKKFTCDSENFTTYSLETVGAKYISEITNCANENSS